MSAHLQGTAPDWGLPVRGKAYGRRMVQRLLRDPSLATRHNSKRWLPFGADKVLEAVAGLVATDPDALEYWMHPWDRVVGLGVKVAESMDQPDYAPEVEHCVLALAAAGLIVLTETGVRLGRDCRPERSRAAAKRGAPPKTPKQVEASRENGAKAAAVHAEKRRRRLLVDAGVRRFAGGSGSPTLPNSGERLTVRFKLKTEPKAEPKTEPMAEPTRAPTEPTDGPMAEPTDGPAAGSGSCAPGLLAAAEDESERILKQQAATAAQAPRAQEPTRKPNGFAAETQAEPTAQPTAVPSADAVALGEEAARQFRFTPQHADEAPGIMRGYLQAGYTAEQVRTVLREKAGKPATSARMLEKALAARFPEALYGVAPRASASATPTLDKPLEHHKDVQRIPGWELLSFELRSAVNHLLRGIDKPTAGDRQRSARYVWSTNRKAFLLVAQVRPEAWSLAGEDPPESG